MEDVGKLTGFPSPSKKPNSFTAIIQMMFLLRCFLFTKNKKKKQHPRAFSSQMQKSQQLLMLCKAAVGAKHPCEASGSNKYLFFFPTHRKFYFTQHFTHPGNHSQVFKSGFLFPTLVTSALGPLPSFGLCDFRYLSLQGQTLPRAFWFQAENKNRCTSKMIQGALCF